jgi:hypothetical protein
LQSYPTLAADATQAATPAEQTEQNPKPQLDHVKVSTEFHRPIERGAMQTIDLAQPASSAAAAVAAEPICYVIDDQDCIIAINAEWIAFAHANAGDTVLPAHVLGRSLWDLIRDPDMRHIYQLLRARVRHAQSIRLNLRCDSPIARRWLTLTLTAVPNDGVEYVSTITHEQPRSYVALSDAAVPRQQELLRICSWCSKVHVPSDQWVEVEDAIALLQLFDATLLPRLTHGMCPMCEQSILESL